MNSHTKWAFQSFNDRTQLQRMKWVLARILQDLPQNRDWLDPDIEKEARQITGDRKPLEVPLFEEGKAAYEGIIVRE